MKLIHKLSLALVGAGMAFGATFASAQEFTLRVQVHFPQESKSGQLIVKFVDDVHVMTQNRVKIEMFWSSSVVSRNF